MEYTFHVTKEKIENLGTLEWEAIERAMDGDFKMYRLRPALAAFMVDENGIPIPFEKAMKETEKLKVKHYQSFIAQFGKGTQETIIPKANGTPSPLPSEVLMVVSESPVG